MVAIGFLVFAGSIAVAAALVMQNRGGTPVQVHAFAHTVTLQPYSILAAGAAIVVAALIGVALMRRGTGRVRRLRREIDQLLAENARLSDLAAGPESSFFFDTFPDDRYGSPNPSPASPSPARSSPTR